MALGWQRWRYAAKCRAPLWSGPGYLSVCLSLAHATTAPRHPRHPRHPPPGVSGVFEAADGAKTAPIEMAELMQGTIVHSKPSPSPSPSPSPLL